jgi:hypothetical protein
MKKVLLTTTALALTAGVASAEITFSGSGEAGFYRTGSSKAVAAKVGVNTAATTTNTLTLTAADATTFGGTTADTGAYNYHATTGELTLTKATGTAATATASSSAAGAAANGSITTAELAVTTAKDALMDANALAEGTRVEADTKATRIAVAQAALAAAEAALARTKGTAAVAAVKAGDMTAYSGYDFNISASGASENGMTFAMGFDMGAGSIADQDDDRAMDAQAGTIATSAMTIGYNGYTIELGDDKIDDLYDDSQNGDVSLAGSFGDLTFKVVTDMQKDVAAKAAVFKDDVEDPGDTGYKAATFTAAVAAEHNPTSYSIGGDLEHLGVVEVFLQLRQSGLVTLIVPLGEAFGPGDRGLVGLGEQVGIPVVALQRQCLFFGQAEGLSQRGVVADAIGAAIEHRGLHDYQHLGPDIQLTGDLVPQGGNEKAHQRLHQFRRSGRQTR